MNSASEVETADSVLNLLTASAEEYLLDQFWNMHLSILPYVNREVLLNAKRDQNPQYYSRSLYVCLLLVGSRFADPNHPIVQKLMANGSQANRLYPVAKQLVEEELESPATLPLVQALLLLGDTEATLERYNKGWMCIGKYPLRASASDSSVQPHLPSISWI